MIERNYGRHIRDDGDAPLRALFAAQTETFDPVADDDLTQLIGKAGATRRIRTADLLITKNKNPIPNLPQSEKNTKETRLIKKERVVPNGSGRL